jgi:hypothetical protein
MSIEIDGMAMGKVYIAQFPSYGKSLAAIERTKENVLESDVDAPFIVSALEEVMSKAELGSQVITDMESERRYLYGVFDPNVDDGTNDTPYDGLLYGEAEDAFDGSGFSAVRLAIWTSEAARNRYDDPSAMGQMMESMVLRTDKDWNSDYPFGIPVNRDTRIKSLFDAHDIGKKYGYIKDLEAVDALPLPEDEKELLIRVVRTWHKSFDNKLVAERLTKAKIALL